VVSSKNFKYGRPALHCISTYDLQLFNNAYIYSSSGSYLADTLIVYSELYAFLVEWSLL